MRRTLKDQMHWVIRGSLLLIISAAIILGGGTLFRGVWNLIWVCMGWSILIGLALTCMFFLTGITPNSIIDQIEKASRPQGQHED